VIAIARQGRGGRLLSEKCWAAGPGNGAEQLVRRIPVGGKKGGVGYGGKEKKKWYASEKKKILIG